MRWRRGFTKLYVSTRPGHTSTPRYCSWIIFGKYYAFSCYKLILSFFGIFASVQVIYQRSKCVPEFLNTIQKFFCVALARTNCRVGSVGH